MTQIRIAAAALTARPAVRELAQQLVARLALAVLLAFLTITVPAAVVTGLVHHSPVDGMHAFITLTTWVVQGLNPLGH